MKKYFLLGAMLLASVPLHAQTMTDAQAMTKARALYGGRASIARWRQFGDVNWTYVLGYKSDGCADKLTSTGEDQTNWENTFAQAMANPPMIGGPFKGLLTVQSSVFSPTGISSVSVVLDGATLDYATIKPATGTLSLTAAFSIDTTLLTNDYHTVCVQAVNSAGVGKTYKGYLFTVNQTTGMGGSTWIPAGSNGAPPSVSPAGYSTAMTAVYMGATGEDFTAGTAVAPDGAPDWHIQLRGIRIPAPIAVQITSGPNASNGTWFEPFNGNNWVIYAQWGGTTGDLWFSQYQPPPQTDFTITVTYIDGSQQQAVASINKAVAQVQ